MLCHGHKGGTGSSSRVLDGIEVRDGERVPTKFTIGCLTQCNYGGKFFLHIGGAPIGRHFVAEDERTKAGAESISQEKHRESIKDGSIIVVLATDAPLSAVQLQRLARRATNGLSKVGGWGSNSSGDIFIAFSTANEIPRDTPNDWKVTVGQKVPIVEDTSLNALFESAVDVVEEAIYNALCMAETMTGPMGVTWKQLDLRATREYMDKFLEISV